jgi:hypothetical protein
MARRITPVDSLPAGWTIFLLHFGINQDLTAPSRSTLRPNSVTLTDAQPAAAEQDGSAIADDPIASGKEPAITEKGVPMYPPIPVYEQIHEDRRRDVLAHVERVRLVEDARRSSDAAMREKRFTTRAARGKRLIVVAAAALVGLGASSPALADAGGVSHQGSCGLGKSFAQAAIADPTSPGATEYALVPPGEFGCTGSN